MNNTKYLRSITDVKISEALRPGSIHLRDKKAIVTLECGHQMHRAMSALKRTKRVLCEFCMAGE